MHGQRRRGGELAVRVELVEERAAGNVGDARALSTEGFRQEEAAPSVDEGGRVELHVLEVQEPRPGPARHRETVTPGARGVGRVKVDLAEAAGRQDRLAGQVRRDGSALALQQVRADDRGSVVAIGRVDGVVREGEQVDGRRLEPPPDCLLPPAGLDQRPLDRGAGRVLDMEDAWHRVRALERPVEAVALPIEGDLELLYQELVDEVRPLPRDQGYGLGRAEPVAGLSMSPRFGGCVALGRPTMPPCA